MRQRMIHGRRRVAIVTLVVLVAVVLGLLLQFPRVSGPGRRVPAIGDLKLGEYLVRAGNCFSCHTAHGGPP